MSTPTSRARRAIAALSATLVLGAGGAAGTLALAAPAGAATVADEASFRTAWDTDTTIILDADITLTCDGGGEAVRTGTEPFTLDGQGHTITQTCAGNRVLQVDSDGGNGIVQHVTITGGSNNQGGFGGGLLYDSSNTLALDHVAIVGNVNCSDGGGLDYEGDSLTITHSTIANNLSGGFGGAIWAGGSTTSIVNSTLSGNTAVAAGALLGGSGELTLTYSTVVQNGFGEGSAPSCADDEGEVPASTGHSGGQTSQQLTPGDAQLVLSAEATGAAAGDSLTSFGSVVALPLGGETNCSVDPASVDSQGYNYSDDGTCEFIGTGDRQSAGDPGLSALGANGGFAPTQVPQPGSPLLDGVPLEACQAGSAAGITTDERDVTRPQGDGCDIGAVEVEVIAPAPLVLAPRFTG